MFFKKQREIDRLRNRVHELEEILCPCSQHDFVQISKDMYFGSSPGEIDYLLTLQCKRCKKVVKKFEYM